MREQTPDARPVAFELLEGALLAAVAVITAWAGYQAALWNSKSASGFATASSYRIQEQGELSMAGQQMLYDATTFGAWLTATEAGDMRLASVMERRFRPEYRPAFDAWLQTDPLHNPAAPPGPAAMPQYRLASQDRAVQLEKEGAAAAQAADHARDVSDNYVRVTVFLAMVLFLVAVSQHFRVPRVRGGILVLGVVMLAYALFSLFTVEG